MRTSDAKMGKQFADLLEPNESLVAGATFSAGSILGGALGGGGSPQVKCGLTDQRVLILSAGLRGGKLLRTISLSEIVAARTPHTTLRQPDSRVHSRRWHSFSARIGPESDAEHGSMMSHTAGSRRSVEPISPFPHNPSMILRSSCFSYP
jgi:hypothetical protein